MKKYKYIVEKHPAPPLGPGMFRHEELGRFDTKDEMYEMFPKLKNERCEEFYEEDGFIIKFVDVWWSGW